MTKRAFDTSRNWLIHLFRCLETPHSDVLKHHTAGAPAFCLFRAFSYLFFPTAIVLQPAARSMRGNVGTDVGIFAEYPG